MTEIFRFLFFTEISSYFLEESDRKFGEVLIKGGVLIFNSFVVYLFRAEGAKILRIPGATWINAPLVHVVYLSGTRGGALIHSYRLMTGVVVWRDVG